MPTKSIAVRIPDDLYEYLVNRAQKEHRTLSNLVISILFNEKEEKEMTCDNCVFSEIYDHFSTVMCQNCKINKGISFCHKDNGKRKSLEDLTK